jgi:hypothetical protein
LQRLPSSTTRSCHLTLHHKKTVRGKLLDVGFELLNVTFHLQDLIVKVSALSGAPFCLVCWIPNFTWRVARVEWLPVLLGVLRVHCSCRFVRRNFSFSTAAYDEPVASAQLQPESGVSAHTLSPGKTRFGSRLGHAMLATLVSSSGFRVGTRVPDSVSLGRPKHASQ